MSLGHLLQPHLPHHSLLEGAPPPPPVGGSREKLCNNQLAFGLQRGGCTSPVFPTLTMSSKLLCVRTGQNR